TAGESEAEKKDDIECSQRERDGIEAKGVESRPGDRRTDDAADPPHRRESSASGDEIGALEALAENGERDGVDGEGAGAENENERGAADEAQEARTLIAKGVFAHFHESERQGAQADAEDADQPRQPAVDAGQRYDQRSDRKGDAEDARVESHDAAAGAFFGR